MLWTTLICIEHCSNECKMAPKYKKWNNYFIANPMIVKVHFLEGNFV